MKQQIKRVTLTGTKSKVEFDNLSGEYMVKNFSDDAIYVSFDENFTQENSVKIPANFYQIITANDKYDERVDLYKTKSIYIDGTGEVEVQQLWYD